MSERLMDRLMRNRLMKKARASLLGSRLGPDRQWCRIVMNRETEKLIAALDTKRLDALEVSGNRWQSAPFRSYRSVSYPEFDACSPPSGMSADLVIAEQVFEHLLWPYRAGKAIYDLLRPEGFLLVTTPFLIKIHDAPVDCSRWTETGIKYFLAECGFPLGKIRTGSWGNRKCVASNFRRWTPFIKGIHCLENEPEFPMVVWALAGK
ncbi:MAG: methyltransferase domain-containing protein [Candidatus Aminicenantales bacterium]